MKSIFLVFLTVAVYFLPSQCHAEGSKKITQLKWGDNADILRFVKPFLPEDPIIIEAGAYDGRESLAIANFFPKAKVYTFEPVPELYLKLQENVKTNPNIKTFQKALCDKNGTSTFFLSVDNSDPSHVSCSSSLLKPKQHLKDAPYVSFPNQIEVETTKLDTWAAQEKVDHVDFLWLDMQGYELNMIKASHIAKNAKVIWMEIGFTEAYTGQYQFKDILAWMNANGFELVASNVNVDNPNYWFGDGMFVRRSTISAKE